MHLSTPQAIADELLRVDQARRVRVVQARTAARLAYGPLADDRDQLEQALASLTRVSSTVAASAIDAVTAALADIQNDIDEAMRAVALRFRLFANDDETEDFDALDIDAVLPAAEAARRQWRPA